MCATNICVQIYRFCIYIIHFCSFFFYAPIFVCISLPTECFLKVKFLNLAKRQVWPMHLWANPKTLPSECRPEYRHRYQKIVGIAPKLRISWQDLKILVTASFAMMITFNDPVEPKEIPFVQDAERTAIWRGLTLQLDAGKATASHRWWHSKIVGRPNLKVKSLQTPPRSGKAGRRFASIIFVCQ